MGVLDSAHYVLCPQISRFHDHCRAGLRPAEKTVRNFVSHLHRLYEQKRTSPEGAVDLGAYLTRWVAAGLEGIPLSGLEGLASSGDVAEACEGGGE